QILAFLGCEGRGAGRSPTLAVGDFELVRLRAEQRGDRRRERELETPIPAAARDFVLRGVAQRERYVRDRISAGVEHTSTDLLRLRIRRDGLGCRRGLVRGRRRHFGARSGGLVVYGSGDASWFSGGFVRRGLQAAVDFALALRIAQEVPGRAEQQRASRHEQQCSGL